MNVPRQLEGRRIDLSFGGHPSPELAKLIEEADTRHEQALARKYSRKVVASHRKPPECVSRPIRTWSPLQFPAVSSVPLTFELRDVALYDNGLFFKLASFGGSSSELMLGGRVNLGHRIKNNDVGRVYLGIILADGRVVSNKRSMPYDAPEDSDPVTPWLYGGASRGNADEVNATYFVSPAAAVSSSTTVTIAYPEIGLDNPLSVVLKWSESR